MYFSIHLAKMDRPYVGICKIHTDKIKKYKKIHFAETYLFILFFKLAFLHQH